MGVEEPTITWEPGSHVRRQVPWKLISVPNRFGINGKEKLPFKNLATIGPYVSHILFFFIFDNIQELKYLALY